MLFAYGNTFAINTCINKHEQRSQSLWVLSWWERSWYNFEYYIKEQILFGRELRTY